MATKRSRASVDEQQLPKQLAAAPLVDVLGVLAASGVGGAWARGDTRWTLRFSFASWCIAGGPVRTQELSLRRKVRESEIDQFRKLIKPDAVTRIRARVVEDSVFGRPEALLVRVLGRDRSDAELNAEIKRLQEPVRIKDKTFGTFTLDRRLNWFVGKATWNGRKVRLSMSAHEPAEVEHALHVATTLWRAQKAWRAKVLAFAIKRLLPLKNDVWLEADESPLSAKQFQARLKLEGITVAPDGSFEYWHDDDDLFGGHAIQISGSLSKGVYDADLPG